MIYTIDILGTIAFAISGTLIALEKRMDLFGVLIIASVTAVGGGAIRDVIIGNTPISCLKDVSYTYTIISSSILTIVFKSKINYLRKSLFLFDTIGIGLYTLIGIEKAIEVNLHPIIAIAIGTISASFGGVIRDILCNEIPVIFRKEIYATACILGGISYFILSFYNLDRMLIFIISGSIIITARLIAVKFKISLPSLYKS